MDTATKQITFSNVKSRPNSIQVRGCGINKIYDILYGSTTPGYFVIYGETMPAFAVHCVMFDPDLGWDFTISPMNILESPEDLVIKMTYKPLPRTNKEESSMYVLTLYLPEDATVYGEEQFKEII